MRSGDHRIDACLSVRAGRLWIEGCDAADLADRVGTPLNVLSEDQVRRNVRCFQREFAAQWPEGEVRILPAIKAAPYRALARILATEGLGADCFGGNELELAIEAGIPGELISLNGPHKGPAAIRRAIECRARITLDNTDEIDVVREMAGQVGESAHVRFRLRPDFSAVDEPTQFHREAPIPAGIAAQRYRLGTPTEAVIDAGREVLRCDEFVMTGVHMHFGRHRASADVWRKVIAAYATLVADLSKAWDGWLPEVIDVGGGFTGGRDPLGIGYAYDSGEPHETVPSVSDYAAAVAETLRTTLAERRIGTAGMTLEVEPGRAVFGDAGVHLARVCGVKSEREGLFPLQWVETDTSDSFLPDVNIGDRMPILAATNASASAHRTADVVGASCNFDVLCADAELPVVQTGDVLAFLDTGAYHEAASNNFNLQQRPATVLVRGDEAETIRMRETLKDVLHRDLMPSWLEQDVDGNGVAIPEEVAR